MLRLERLEPRDCPATLASVLPHYAPGWAPTAGWGVTPDQVEVLSADLDPADRASPIADVFVATAPGLAARVKVTDGDTGRTLSDQFAYDPAFRGGISSTTVIGADLYLACGDGGGPVIAKLNLVTGELNHFWAPLPRDWRGGLRITSADVDHVNGGPSPDPTPELIAIPGGDSGALHVSILDAATAEVRRSFVVNPERRGGWQFAPALTGVALADGEQGMVLDPAGSVPDPLTRRVTGSIEVTWAGDVVPLHDPFGFVTPV